MSIDLTLSGFAIGLSIQAFVHHGWATLSVTRLGDRWVATRPGVRVELTIAHPPSPKSVAPDSVAPAPTPRESSAAAPDGPGDSQKIEFTLRSVSEFRTRIRLLARVGGQTDVFHLIPANIHGDNNAPHVRPGEFPCLTADGHHQRNRAALWEFRADRAPLPVSMICCDAGTVALAIDPYSDCKGHDSDEGFIRNGLLAALPDVCGVSLGYGNDPLTFQEKTVFRPASADLHHGAAAAVTLYARRGDGRSEAHRIIRDQYARRREKPAHHKTPREALRALADAFAQVSWSEQLGQYTNRKCEVPVNTELTPWRAIVEIGWTGGSMLAYPFALAERVFPDLRMPKGSTAFFDQICHGFNEATGLINDTAVNAFTREIPPGWNASQINGWWSGFLPQTRDNHCAYNNAHAAYYLLAASLLPDRPPRGEGASSPHHGSAQHAPPHHAAPRQWVQTALRVLDTAVSLQRADGAFGYIFDGKARGVIDWEGFAGCWFAAALPLAWKATGDRRYLDAAERALNYYAPFVAQLTAWGSPMDTYKSIDSEGNLAFVRAARLMHEATGDDRYIHMLLSGAHYEYLWRYGFRTRPQCRPLKGSHWNACGGSITSVSNPHIHPMSVVITRDLEYLAAITGDDYHQQRADDGMAWLMNTMELYPDVVGYGRYGVLSERTCPSDGLLAETYRDDGTPASTWWSYNAWAAGSAMEALGEKVGEEGGKKGG